MLSHEFNSYCSNSNVIKMILLNKYYYKQLNIYHINNLISQKMLYNNKIKNMINYNINDNTLNLQNVAISKIDHLYKLKKLSLQFCGEIDNFKKLTKIVELFFSRNDKINNINCLYNLKVLSFDFNSRIDQKSIRNLTKIIKLNCTNTNIKNVNHLQNLKELYCCGSNIDQYGIEKLSSIDILDCYGNS